MKCASVPSEYRNCILRDSVRTARNFSPARKVLSMTLPSEARRSLVRTNAPPLPGLTCWNSTILKTVPSTSMWAPFLNWLVLITGLRVAARVAPYRDSARLPGERERRQPGGKVEDLPEALAVRPDRSKLSRAVALGPVHEGQPATTRRPDHVECGDTPGEIAEPRALAGAQVDGANGVLRELPGALLVDEAPAVRREVELEHDDGASLRHPDVAAAAIGADRRHVAVLGRVRDQIARGPGRAAPPAELAELLAIATHHPDLPPRDREDESPAGGRPRRVRGGAAPWPHDAAGPRAVAARLPQRAVADEGDPASVARRRDAL